MDTTDRGVCSKDGCERPALARTLCRKHYDRARKTGEVASVLVQRHPGVVQVHSLSDVDKDARTGVCAVCGPVDVQVPRSGSGRGVKCGNRHRANRRASDARRQRKLPPDAYRRKMLRRQYGLSPEQYADMLAFQGGGCAICFAPQSGPRALSVDHDHSTGHVRGILCRACNTALGFLNDDPARLWAAIAYLEAASDRQRKASKKRAASC